MHNDARNKEIALGRIKRLASSGLPLEPFIRGVFELVNDAVPHHPNKAFLAGGADRVEAYFGSTPETTAAIPLHTRFLVESGPELSGAEFRMDSDAMRRVMPAKTIWFHHDIWREDFHRRDGYNHVHRPLGWTQLVLVAYRDSRAFLGFYPIWRGANQKTFSRDDFRFLETSAPFIAHGLKVAQLLQGQDKETESFASLPAWGSGALLMDRGGRLIAMDDRATLIFQHLSFLDRGTSGFVSGETRDALNYVVFVLNSISRGLDSGGSMPVPASKVYLHWTGIVLKFRGVRLVGSTGPELFLILVERGETAKSRRQRLIARWGLSMREAEVLSLVAQGKTGPEIAVLLGISHDTSRKHLSRVFRKLGVENRTAAASMVHEAAVGADFIAAAR